METTAGEGSPGRIGKTGPWGGGSNRKGNKKGSKGIYLMGGGRKVALHDGRTAKKGMGKKGHKQRNSTAHINHKHVVRKERNGVDEIVGRQHTANVLVVPCASTCEAGCVFCVGFWINDEDSI